ncbi:MAG: hypothetical protein LBE36_00685 [Flavobacteriaceae bacterium]|jgi:hypothetical protein|nr:hypothetical protein [Flavobacteriaceae bacterium]
MKKLFSFLFIGLLATIPFSCNDDDPPPPEPIYAVVRDITGSFNNGNGYTISQGLVLNNSDVVLVYRKDGTDGGNPIWRLIPDTWYFGDVDLDGFDDELDYSFDFTINDVLIYAGGTINFNDADVPASFKDDYLNNQTFRVILIPAFFDGKPAVDYNDYNAVIKYYNIDDSKVQKL